MGIGELASTREARERDDGNERRARAGSDGKEKEREGYLYEVCKKVMSPGGFMYIVREVLGRKKVTDDSFGQKKFQEQNLNRISEALRDVAFAFGMAAALEFRGSDSFPSQDLLRRGKREIAVTTWSS